MKKIALTCLILGSALAGLSACNTIDGFGRDLQSAGRTISGPD